MKKKFIYTISAVVFLLYASPAFASTVSVPVGSNIEVTNMYYTASTNEYTINGQNLPILSGTEGGYGGGTDYQNFCLDDNGNLVGLNTSPHATYGIYLQQNTSSEIVFSSPFQSLSGSDWNLYLAPAGTIINAADIPPYGSSAANYTGTYDGTNNTFSPAITQAPVVSVTSESPTSITLSWNPVPGADTYNFYVNGSTTAAETGITGTSGVLSGLTAGTYSVQVAGVGPGGAGPLSTDVLAETTTPLPAVTVNASSNLIGGLNVSWNQETGAVDYNIEVNGSLDVPDYTGDSITLSNYPLNTPVSIVVYPLDQYGNVGTPSATATATPTLAGPKLSYGNLTSKSVTLNWTPVPGATSYQVYENDPTLVATTSGTSTTINSLQTGQTYSFSVTALTPNGTSLPSSPISIYVTAVNYGMSGTDVWNNAVAIVASLAGLLLLALAVEFSPRLLKFLRKIPTAQQTTESEYDPTYPHPQTISPKEISPVSYDD